MKRFIAADYKERLTCYTSCEICEKVPLPRLKDGTPYIFISYSHKDYKKVYCDLADLYENGIPFWYDSGLPAGKNWDDVVFEKMTDPNCVGVIFYLSENLFLSRSIQTEIQIACGDDDDDDGTLPNAKRDYFCINLTSKSPSEILKNVFSSKSFPDAEDPMAAQCAWINLLTKAFPDKATYLSFDHPHHKENLVQQIDVNFGIESNHNPFDFGSAIFRSGRGVIEFKNGVVYEGEFLNGLFDGYGKITHSDGTVYEGEWKKGKTHGQGRMICSNGTIYMGGWEMGKSNGQVKVIYPDGACYEGFLKRGLRHGQGTITCLNGVSYTGEWENNRRYGEGTEVCANGSTYTGGWVYGKRHGMGIETFPDGGSYEGEWMYGKRHGHGKIIYSNKKRGIYEGTFYCGKPHGKGKITYPNGNFYEGEWADGKRHGQGKATYRDGRVYVGEWLDDKKCGHGTMTYPDGAVENGLWKDGVFLGAAD